MLATKSSLLIRAYCQAALTDTKDASFVNRGCYINSPVTIDDFEYASVETEVFACNQSNCNRYELAETHKPTFELFTKSMK